MSMLDDFANSFRNPLCRFRASRLRDADYRLAATALLIHIVSLDGRAHRRREAQAAQP